ncbi:unnamed protein product, partial [Lampetra planeri]
MSATTTTTLVAMVVVVIAIATAVSVEAAPSVETANGTFRFASYYGDHMVLQREPSGAFVWGFGNPGARVVVVLYRAGGSAEGPGIPSTRPLTDLSRVDLPLEHPHSW